MAPSVDLASLYRPCIRLQLAVKAVVEGFRGNPRDPYASASAQVAFRTSSGDAFFANDLTRAWASGLDRFLGLEIHGDHAVVHAETYVVSRRQLLSNAAIAARDPSRPRIAFRPAREVGKQALPMPSSGRPLTRTLPSVL